MVDEDEAQSQTRAATLDDLRTLIGALPADRWLFNAAGQTYETLLPYAEVVMLGDLPVHTVNLQGLLLTKQTVREKDQIDRRVLERAIEIAEVGAITQDRPRASQPTRHRKDHGNAR